MVTPFVRDLRLRLSTSLMTLAFGCGSPSVPEASAFATCGDGSCEAGESALTCPSDCGMCVGQPNCDDGEQCTLDTCDPVDGCVHAPRDATRCEAGPCVEEAMCVAGKCVGAAKLWSASVSAQPGGLDTATSMVQDQNGDLIAFGNALRGVNDNDNYLIRVSATGTMQAQMAMPKWLQEDLNHDDLIFAVAPLKDGGFLAVGERRGQSAPLEPNPPTWARWIWVKATDDTPEVHHMSIAGNHGLAAVARATDGSLLAVGHVESKALLARFNPDATPGWKIALSPNLPAQSTLWGVTALPTEAPTWVAVGQATDDGQNVQRGWAVQLAGPATDVNWNVELTPPDGLFGALRHVVALPDGGFVALGALDTQPFYGLPPPEKSRVWWVGLNASGAVVWQATSALGWYPQALVRVPGQDLVLAAAEVVVGEPAPWRVLTARSFLGDDRGFATGLLGYPHALVALPDGTLGVAGVIGVGGQHDTWLARVDRWGSPTCASSGACTLQPATRCDDANPCTADGCLKTDGCVHTNFPNGTPCGPKLVCKEGQCESN